MEIVQKDNEITLIFEARGMQSQEISESDRRHNHEGPFGRICRELQEVRRQFAEKFRGKDFLKIPPIEIVLRPSDHSTALERDFRQAIDLLPLNSNLRRKLLMSMARRSKTEGPAAIREPRLRRELHY